MVNGFLPMARYNLSLMVGWRRGQGRRMMDI